MADVVVKVRGGQVAHLPGKCLCCGEPATAYKERKLIHYPAWAWLLFMVAVPFGVLPAWIILLLAKKEVRLDAPLCQRHRHHFLWRPLLGLGFIFLMMALFPVAIVLGVEAEKQLGKGSPVPLVLTLGWLVAFFGGTFAVILWGWLTTVRATRITEHEATLSRVAPAFAEVCASGASAGWYSRQEEKPPSSRGPSREVKADPSKIRHVCPSCDSVVYFSEHLAGLSVKCPECRALIEVPG